MYRIAYLLDKHTSGFAVKEAKEQKQFKYKITLDLLWQSDLDKQEIEGESSQWRILDKADFIILASHGSITFFKQFNAFWERYKGKKKIYFQSGIEEEITTLFGDCGLTRREYETIYRYFEAKSVENTLSLSYYLATHFGNCEYEYSPPLMPQWEGIYYPKHKCWEIVQKEIEEAEKQKKAVVALLFHYYLIANNNLEHIEAMLRGLENQGVYCYALFTSSTKDEKTAQKGIKFLLEKYIKPNGKSLPHTIINTIGYSMTVFESNDTVTTDSGSVFDFLNIPIIQAFPTYFNRKEWENSTQGLDAMSLVSAIYYPEFDGQICGYPIATNEYDIVKDAYYFTPIWERIELVARMAKNWSVLQRVANDKKRIAIIFHNYPARNDQIGSAAGLDSPATVFNIIRALKELGVKMEYDFDKADDVIYRIIDTVSNDNTWMSCEEMIENSEEVITTKQYQKWYDDIPKKSCQQIEKDWGKAPGTFRVHKNKLPVPGIINGNVFIGLQPPRGYEEQAEKCYHSTDITCPHQYISFYKWIKHVFKANAIIHIGTHGSLEWLPGKEKGLSSACFPSINIEDIPHLYIYHMSVIGEGIQAKRRASAVLLNHLIPSSTESGTYDELTDLDNYIKEYIENSKGRQAQQADLKNQIWELCLRLSLDVDLKIENEQIPEDFDNFVHDLHAWIEIIKQSNVKDGLHIFNKIPEKERFNNLVRVLVRTRSGDVPSLNSGIAEALGFNYDEIVEAPSIFYKPGKTGYMIKDECTEIAQDLIEKLAIEDYHISYVPQLIDRFFPDSKDTAGLATVLEWVCNEVSPRLRRTTDEMYYTVRGFLGGFVSPGKGGTPTRGNTLILPTGRNMFALDPSAVPSRAAYSVGVRMANQLIERYQKDEGKLPEAIGMIIYSGDQMRTAGEDIAEILHLMGVRPRWIGSSNRVSGIELISLEELKRPRLDVTCRISGLFRDTFPMLTSLLDDAVKLVASVDEPEEMNYIKKHFNEDIAELKAKGMDEKTARQESLVRVFGCPPGTYGGGVSILIESKEWKTQQDLANISMAWSCHAYTNDIHGKVCNESYTQRLSKIDLTVKNENTTDFDIYDIDDEFIYHGGMIASVAKLSGKKPQSYYGNSSDADHTKVASVSEETARIMRSRLLNPKWIEGLKQHGFKGAQDVAYNMENVFGWDATADVVEDWAYEALANHFLFNEKNRAWLSDTNPWAIHQITERLLEAIQRGMWKASEEMIEKLKNMYLKSEGDLEGR